MPDGRGRLQDERCLGGCSRVAWLQQSRVAGTVRRGRGEPGGPASCRGQSTQGRGRSLAHTQDCSNLG